MVRLNNHEKWRDIQENVDKIDYLVRDASKKGFATAHELGHLSFLSALVLEQTEQIMVQERQENRRF